MNINIHRGTHQIGGIATEIQTKNTRILIDMGDELSLDPDFVPSDLIISGVTDTNENCDAVFFTHYHGDHIGQMTRIRQDIPLFSGALAKDVMLMSAEHSYKKNQALCDRIKTINTFKGGEELTIGDIRITPWSIDHSACDSYLFLIEADGKRILYTGDFRMHGFRGHAIPKILRKIGKVDALITEGTTLSRPDNSKAMTERELQAKVREYMKQYKYVYILCASTNLERLCALSKAVPTGKYFICDEYQRDLLELLEKHWGNLSSLFRDFKKTVYGNNIQGNLQKCGFLMAVRDNQKFRQIISKFDREQSIMLYSMWDGYRTKPDSTITDFLNLASRWETLHTSGHVSHEDLKTVIDIADPDIVIPMHSEAPNMLKTLCPNKKILISYDGKEITI